MKNFILCLLAIPLLAACGQVVEVPPAHKGKILTENGYKPETIPPSKFRLDPCFMYCDKLALIETSDRGMTEQFKLFMPKDQLNMSFDIRFTMSVNEDEATVDSVFSKMSPSTAPPSYNAHYLVTANAIYETYGQPIIREKIRSVVAEYSINEVASSREAINHEVFKAVKQALIGTPITVKRLAFADLQFPDVIVQAKEAAAERQVAIERAKAEKEVELVKLETQLEVAKKDRAVRREKAEAAREENQIFSERVSQKNT